MFTIQISPDFLDSSDQENFSSLLSARPEHQACLVPVKIANITEHRILLKEDEPLGSCKQAIDRDMVESIITNSKHTTPYEYRS